MIRRLTRKRLRHIFAVSVFTLLLNIFVPMRPVNAATVHTPLPDKQIFAVRGPVVLVDSARPTTHVVTLASAKPKTIASTILKVGKRWTVRATAYSSTVDQTDSDPFTTASGMKVRDGIIAANGLRFGTKVRIPQYFGDKIFVVQDRMNAKWGTSRIDIWMPTRHQAIQWGVRTVTIEIVS